MANKSELVASRLTSGTIYKLIFIGCLGCHILFVLLVVVVMALTGEPLNMVEGASLTCQQSIMAISLYAVFGVLGAFFWSAMSWIVIWPIFRLYSLWRPLKLRYVVQDENGT